MCFCSINSCWSLIIQAFKCTNKPAWVRWMFDWVRLDQKPKVFLFVDFETDFDFAFSYKVDSSDIFQLAYDQKACVHIYRQKIPVDFKHKLFVILIFPSVSRIFKSALRFIEVKVLSERLSKVFVQEINIQTYLGFLRQLVKDFLIVHWFKCIVLIVLPSVFEIVFKVLLIFQRLVLVKSLENLQELWEFLAFLWLIINWLWAV